MQKIHLRPNPKVAAAPREIASVVSRHPGKLRDAGADVRDIPLGCGKYGCVWPASKTGWVVKLTRDKDEVEMVRLIRRIRSGRLKPRKLTPSRRKKLASLGVTAAWVKRVPGFTGMGAPVSVQRTKQRAWYAYAREDVTPAVDLSLSPKFAARYKAISDGLDIYHYTRDWRGALRGRPFLRTILATVVGLEALYGIQIGDIHSEQVGITRHRLYGRPRGTLVLYDGWVE